MFEFVGSPVPVRQDLRNVYVETWQHFASPGPTLTATERIGLARHVRAARSSTGSEPSDLPIPLLELAATLFTEPGLVDGILVRNASDEVGDAMVIEVISIVSMLSAIDGTHRALGAELEPLPDPSPGAPTGAITEGLRARRTHVPMPRGAIPVALDLIPDESAAYQSLFGPQYMTDAEMVEYDFARTPGLDRDQMELVSSRTSLHNECFY